MKKTEKPIVDNEGEFTEAVVLQGDGDFHNEHDIGPEGYDLREDFEEK